MHTDKGVPEEHGVDGPDETRPGALQGEVWLNIQTYQAQSLIRGRRSAEGKPAIIGLVGFAERLKILWQAVRFDDPFADWWLIKVEERVSDVRSQLGVLQKRLESILVSDDCFEVAFAQSSRPQRVSLQFANPYAFRAAQMLADYDRMLCTWMTARHLGMTVPSDLTDQIQASGRWLRGVFALPQGYHHLEVRRSDVQQGTARAGRARERMGDLPQEVLNGDRLPALRPISYRPNDVSNTISRQDG